MLLGLLAAEFQEVVAIDPCGKPEIIIDLRFPPGHGVARIDDEGVALRAPQINGSGQSSDAAADHNDFVLIHKALS